MNNLKFFRTRECKTMEQVAKEIGTSRQAVCGYENEYMHRPIPTSKINKLCNFLNCGKFELLGEEAFRVEIQNDAERAELIELLFKQITDPEEKGRIKEYVEKN